ncbi:hypothetical protein AMK16_20355 [Streptomyces sp. CB00455]|nr:hypothetical protein AMK16_20355 [Streptomyces sp. CB00455]
MGASYEALAAAVTPLGEEESWRPTGCAGWVVRDLVHHCLADCRRALVALHTPHTGPPDRDAVTYWQQWRPDSADAAQERRSARLGASTYPDFAPLRELYLETAAAAVTAAARTGTEVLVSTQGHVLTAGDLMATLTVEATVHHLDLTYALPAAPGPSAAGLASVRSALDGLLGRPVPLDWDDGHYARAATGRVPLTDTERRALGRDAERFPLFG